jgi:hypothetical protein
VVFCIKINTKISEQSNLLNLYSEGTWKNIERNCSAMSFSYLCVKIIFLKNMFDAIKNMQTSKFAKPIFPLNFGEKLKTTNS